jgi:hypothetical protein
MELNTFDTRRAPLRTDAQRSRSKVQSGVEGGILVECVVGLWPGRTWLAAKNASGAQWAGLVGRNLNTTGV